MRVVRASPDAGTDGSARARAHASTPRHPVDVHGLVEALELNEAFVLELDRLSEAQLAHGARHEDATALTCRAHPSSELDSSTEEVVVLGHGLAGTDGDTDVEWHFIRPIALDDRPLDRDR